MVATGGGSPPGVVWLELELQAAKTGTQASASHVILCLPCLAKDFRLRLRCGRLGRRNGIMIGWPGRVWSGAELWAWGAADSSCGEGAAGGEAQPWTQAEEARQGLQTRSGLGPQGHGPGGPLGTLPNSLPYLIRPSGPTWGRPVPKTKGPGPGRERIQTDAPLRDGGVPARERNSWPYPGRASWNEQAHRWIGATIWSTRSSLGQLGFSHSSWPLCSLATHPKGKETMQGTTKTYHGPSRGRVCEVAHPCRAGTPQRIPTTASNPVEGRLKGFRDWHGDCFLVSHVEPLVVGRQGPRERAQLRRAPGTSRCSSPPLTAHRSVKR